MPRDAQRLQAALTSLLTPEQNGDRSKSGAASTTSRKDGRLPDEMWRIEDEFPGGSTIASSYRSEKQLWLSREKQVIGRIARASMKGILQPTRLAILGGFSVTVLGLTTYEAHVLLDPMMASSPDALRFTCKYAVENFFASCIWETRPPELVAEALGITPESILRTFHHDLQQDAALQLHLMAVYTTRSVVGGVMIIAQLLSIVRESMLAAFAYLENVYEGKEPPLKGVQERIIRLAGDGSDVTEVSMARYGAHILPVYENPSKVRYLVALWSLNGRVPCIWQVGAGRYGYRHSWNQLEIDGSYMLRSTTGKSILCIEADATNLDRAHDLQKPTNDITLEDASQAYRMIERAASRKIQRPFRSLCVFLGDSLQLCDTGGKSFVTLRDRVRLKKEVDVLIDAKAPLLLEILKWCARFVGKRKTIVLDATPLNYAPLQLLLERNGYTVVDPLESSEYLEQEKQVSEAIAATAGANSDSDASKKPDKLPRLIYYPTTAATINAVHSVLSTGNTVDPKRCCVLINSPFGLAHLDEIADAEGERFYPICAAEIYDDYFRQVRIWTRMGHSPSVIQSELDERFAEVYDVQVEIAKLARSTTTMKKL
uniref:Uncharacterized protein n=1 Tax=Globisporangium ultimum (strain ATCC 200006 / CBS 805.95 / DAOM BR144) TaxID=431595 RepID=K3X875_GLOUD